MRRPPTSAHDVAVSSAATARAEWPRVPRWLRNRVDGGLTGFPELDALERILPELEPHGRVEVLTTVTGRIGGLERRYPLYGIVLGQAPPTSPVFLLVGGIHGLERIGTMVVLAYLTSLVRQLEWDQILRDSLRRVRIAFLPMMNPVGMAARTRANGSGVDLMRNAPQNGEGWGTPLVGGQRLSPRLPWYMGERGAPMEREAQALVDFARRELFSARVAIAIDVHSGFGMLDRLWFPYARTRKPLPHLPEIFALKRLLDRTLPHHIYEMEPQAQVYTIVGDLWDYLYDAYRAAQPDGTFIPLTLEMGSWLWVKKNPLQLLSVLGSFNPILPHRLRRTLRRHLQLFNFLHHASASPHSWSGFAEAPRRALRSEAFSMWYGR